MPENDDTLGLVSRLHHMPADFAGYLVEFVAKKPGHEYSHALRDAKSCGSLTSNLGALFRSVANTLGISQGEVMTTFELGSNDFRKGSLEAFVAELRVCSYLANIGFTSLKRIPRPNADFVGSYGEMKYAIEVFCIVRDDFAEPLPFPSGDSPAYRLDRDAFERKVFEKCTEKKVQLDATMKSCNCNRGLMIAVNDAESMLNLNTHSTFLKVLKRIFEKLSWGNSYHVGIFTGSVTLGEGSQDCIFPPIEQIATMSETKD